MTEIALEPVRLLARRTMLASVSLRTPSSGRLFLITISKRFPDGRPGQGAKPVYTWDVREIDQEGAPLDGGDHRRSTPGAVYEDPEDAYWAAVNGLCQLSGPRRPS
jgi:hypothetical protein